MTGAVCLNILRLDWRPVLAVNAICFGLLMLFNEPSSEEPLNIEAGRLLECDKRRFEGQVRECMGGGEVGGVVYDRVLLT
jgi:ubiquitin-conjugating enzyme E2 M